jgi:hypothetical protein
MKPAMKPKTQVFSGVVACCAALLLTVTVGAGLLHADDQPGLRASGSPSQLLTGEQGAAGSIKAQPLRGSLSASSSTATANPGVQAQQANPQPSAKVGVPVLLAKPADPVLVPMLLARPDLDPVGNEQLAQAQQASTQQGAAPAAGGDDWLVPEKPVVANAAPARAQAQASAQVVPEGMVALGEGLRPVQPGYTLGSERTPWSGQARVQSAWAVRPTRIHADGRHSRSGGMPAFTYPYAGYYNNPFTGFSGYQAGYAGRPPSTVPFNGGLHQSQSAFYSVPNMVVPVYPVYPIGYRPYVPVYRGPACGVGYYGAQSGTSLSISINARF